MSNDSTRQADAARPARRDGLRYWPIDDEAVVYDLAHDAVHYLNTTACFIWERCDGHRTADQIAVELVETFDHAGSRPAPRDAARADVLSTLAELSNNGLMD